LTRNTPATPCRGFGMDGSMSTRTFLALDLDDAIRRQLGDVQRELERVGAAVRWTEVGQIHVTLKFLGDVADEDLARVCEIAAKVAAGVESFDFMVTGVTSAPPTGQMRMVWVDIADPTGRMAELHRRLDDAYAELGFRKETRRFRPHLTLGRVKSGRKVPELRRAIAAIAGRQFGNQPAERVTVYSSQLRPSGPIYTPLAEAPLGN